MRVLINPHRFSGVIKVPPSKSHTIRQLFIASLANGVSQIHNPLDSLDTRSCVSVCRAFGAEITERRAGGNLVSYIVKGNQIPIIDTINHRSENSRKKSYKDENSLPSIYAGNSGTTLFFALAIAGLQETPVIICGDEQVNRRSAVALLKALGGLGIQSQNSNGCSPVTIKGPWAGGKVILPCHTSQFLSAMLIAAPLAPSGTITEIEVPLLNEKPYVDMTLSYLTAHGIPFQHNPDYSFFRIPGGSSWKATSSTVPGDFSSAAFPAAAAAITGGPITLLGLNSKDTQGDKFFLNMLEIMGCKVNWHECSTDERQTVTISREGILQGGTFNLNAVPDLFPAAAAIAAYAQGDTTLVNISHVRAKETDRIAVMTRELRKLGVKCTELPDGLTIHGNKGSALSPPAQPLFPDGDHRITMALAIAALGCKGPVEVTGAESVNISYPGFFELLYAI